MFDVVFVWRDVLIGCTIFDRWGVLFGVMFCMERCLCFCGMCVVCFVCFVWWDVLFGCTVCVCVCVCLCCCLVCNCVWLSFCFGCFGLVVMLSDGNPVGRECDWSVFCGWVGVWFCWDCGLGFFCLMRMCLCLACVWGSMVFLGMFCFLTRMVVRC